MKNIYSFLVAILFLSMLLLPLTAGKSEAGEEKPREETEQTENEDVFLIKTDDGIKELSAEDYITGVVAAEMPALYGEEALKAQAVAAYTYAARKRLSAGNGEYHLTDKSSQDQAYITDEVMKSRFKENYDSYKKKIGNAVSAVCGQALTYNGEPIFAAYHAISSGKTETGENVWGGEYPYLKSVLSVYDKLASDYKSEAEVTREEFFQKLELPNGGEIGKVEVTEAGTVKNICIGDKNFAGTEMRKLFSLRSACFSIEQTETGYRFTVYGYGHGVGLSQHGAKIMAEQGFDYKEILKHYYPDCELTEKAS